MEFNFFGIKIRNKIFLDIYDYMPNAIKYNVSAETLALKKGNFYIGTGDVGKGPTSSTGYYNGVTIPSGGYVIYSYNASLPGNTAYFTAANDSQLISYTNGIAGQTFTTSGQCVNWFATQTDKMIFNIDYPAIITSGLTLNLDAGFIPSYSQSGTTWYDVSSGGNNGTLTNGPTFSSANGGSIVFDAVDDFVSLPSQTAIFSNSSFTVSLWMYPTSDGEGFNQMIFSSIGPGPDFNSKAVLIRLKDDTGILFAFYNDDLNTATGAYVYDAWQYVVCTYNYATDTSSIYVNGVSKATGANGPCTETGTMTTRIAKWFNQEYYFGRVSLCSLYNRSLSQTEITQNFNATRGRFGI